MPPPREIVLTLPGFTDPLLAIAACRAGGLGVLNLEYEREIVTARETLSALARHTTVEFGVKFDANATDLNAALLSALPPRARFAIVTGREPAAVADLARALAQRSVRVLLEVRSLGDADLAGSIGAFGLVAKGLEAGGRVGEETTFILLQRLLGPSRGARSLPIWAHGGIGPHTAAACAAAGAAGVVLDWQLSLTREARRLPASLRTRIASMDGSETGCLGEGFGASTRLYAHPGVGPAERLRQLDSEITITRDADGDAAERFDRAVLASLQAPSPEERVWLIGQDAAFAAALASRHRTVGGVLQATRRAIDGHLSAARRLRPLDADSPLARSHRTRYPVLQGPMTRVSDVAPFAESVASGGALPFLALALMRAPEVRRLLEETKERLGEQPWGVGILGFVPLELRKEQLSVIREVRPPFALIAGGRPAQAGDLEKDGIATYLHVPSPGLLKMFLGDGARRFIFEGRECGGHVGPRSSFVLWQGMVDVLLESVPPGEFDRLHVIFAGGIHDALSASMVAALAAPLAEAGAKIGVLLGTAYIFTAEAVASGAIEPAFQEEARRCRRTVLLESGPGHATRCVDTTFAREFTEARGRLIREGIPAAQIRDHLEQMNLGRLRIASKGIVRESGGNGAADPPRYRRADEDEQRRRGMYMIGQVAELRDETTTIAALHHEVTKAAMDLLARTDGADVETAAPAPSPSDVAIVGIGCLLPKSKDVSSFWENILQKRDAITEVPPDRWDWKKYYDNDPKTRDKIYSRWGGFIEEIPFDPLRYGMPPNTLASIEPAQLLALEVTRAALQDADYLGRDFDREHTSVIFGAGGGVADLGAQYCMRSHLPLILDEVPEEILRRLPEWTEDSFAGILPNVIAGRVANRFDFGGVNFTVDAACASSLAAIYHAVRELESGQSSMVIAGGVDTLQNPFTYLCFAKTQALSPNGRCRTFDAETDGIVISEGLVAVVLKRLSDAERDGDRIYAVIKSVAGSSDGRDRGLTAPRPEGQMRALERAYAKAGFSPASVQLFEAHGTGTVAGDQAEAQSLSRVLAAHGASPASCAVGSVKSMIGHTKCSAGVAGLLKVALSLHNRVLPPTLNVEKPNPKAGFGTGPLYVNSEARPWIASREHPRRAGVSAFGFGGTNFHAVLEEYGGRFLDAPERTARAWPSELFLWSGSDRNEILAAIEPLKETLAKGAEPALADLAYTVCRDRAAEETCGTGQPGHRLTLAVVADSCGDLKSKLARAADHLRSGSEESLQDPRGIYFTDAPLARDGRVAFLFPGQGSQAPDMARDLAVYFSEVREAFERADEVLQDEFDRPLSRFIFPPPAFTTEEKRAAREALTDTRVAQPALGAAGVAIFSLLSRLGVHPDMVAGHSYGEYVALHAAGRLDERTLLILSEARGRAIIEAAREDLGTMAAVDSPADAVEPVLREMQGITIANRNSPRQTVISGSQQEIKRAIERLKSLGFSSRPIPVACAFHSPLVAPARDRLARRLGEIRMGEGHCTVYSNTLATPYPADSGEAVALLADHLVRPVRFQEEIEAMYADGARLFVEAGPGNVLTGLVGQILEARDHIALCIDSGRRHGLIQLQHALARLATHGVQVRTDTLFEGRSLERVDLGELAAQGEETRKPQWMVSGSRVRQLLPHTRDGKEEMQPEKMKSAEAPVAASPRLPLAGGDGAPGPQDRAGKSGDRAAVMIQHQQLMSRFLETQRSVMLAYLQGNAQAARVTEVPPLEPPARDIESVPSRPLPQDLPPTSPPAESAPAQPSPTPAAPPLTLEGVTTKLVGIVSERTGYPTEMLDLDLDLEGDLGVDSIKRVEVLGIFQKTEEAAGLDANEEFMEQLRGLKTLRAIAQFLFDTLSHRAAGPPEPPAAGPPPDPGPSAGPVGGNGRDGAPAAEGIPRARADDGQALRAPERAPPSADEGNGPSGQETEEALAEETRVPRFALRPVDAPLEDLPEGRLSRSRAVPGGLIVITDDGGGVADLLRDRLADLGGSARVVAASGFESAEEALTLIENLRATGGPIGGLIHLAPLAPAPALNGMAPEKWRALIASETKGLFYLLRQAAGDLKTSGSRGEAWVLAATADARSNPHRGAIAGLMKSLALEWPDVRCRGVDFDSKPPPEALAARILAELSAVPGEAVSSWRGDRRRVLRPAETPAIETGDSLDASSVILVTGGARGITAEAARTIAARAKPTLVLVGRSALPVSGEPSDIADADTRQSLRAALLERAREAGTRPTPREIENEVGRILADREIRANLEAMEDAGARVVYHSADVRDSRALGAVIEETYRRFGKIDGVIHGAGIIEDKLLDEKTPESFARVFDTKADSAFHLTRLIKPEGLRFMVFFSSVAGCFGNRGQADYGAANELLNHLAEWLNDRWPARVVSLNWGPWDRVGMVSPEVKRQFADSGVQLIPVEGGCEALLREIRAEKSEEAVIVLGDGPWGAYSDVEAGTSGPPRPLSETKTDGPTARPTPSTETDGPSTPLLHRVRLAPGAGGTLECVRILDPEFDRYLHHHKLEGKPVVPTAVALTLMAEAAQQAWPDLTVVGAEEIQVLRGIKLEERTLPLRLSVRAQTHAPMEASESLGATVEITEVERPERAYYRGVILLGDRLPEMPAAQHPFRAPLRPFPLQLDAAYRRWLFHGPVFQKFERIEGFSEEGILARIRPSRPASCLAGTRASEWLLDPAFLDACLQMVLLWMRAAYDVAGLPSRIRRLRRYAIPEGEALDCSLRGFYGSGDAVGRSDILCLTSEGKLALAIEGFEFTCGKVFNKLMGWDESMLPPSEQTRR